MQSEVTQTISEKEAVVIIPVSAAEGSFDTQLFRGLPLFLWSLLYVKAEGLQAVIITDSEVVEHTAKGFGGIVYRCASEEVSNNAGTLDILRDFESHIIIRVLPTVPFHKTGALISVVQQLRQKSVNSCYTAARVSLEGNLRGEFFYGTSEEMWHVDGNIMGCTENYFVTHGNNFIGEDSKIINNDFPYVCAISTMNEFSTLEALAKVKPELLVHNIRTICCVPNLWSIKRNYAQFIDSCDLVVRSEKLDNLGTGQTGKRIDVVAVSTSPEWYKFSEQEQHLPEINATPLIFMNLDSGGELSDKIRHWYPVQYGKGNSVAEALVDHMYAAFPEATIYTFTAQPRKRVINIDEENKLDVAAIYSTKPEWYMHLPEKIRILYEVWSEDKAHAYIYPWKRRLIIPEKCSAIAQAATVFRWDSDKKLVIKWDNSDVVECYAKSYANLYKKVDVLRKEDVSKESALLAMVPLHYTSVWALGQSSLAHLLVKSIASNALPGVFDKVYVPSFPTAVDLLCKRGEGWLERDALSIDALAGDVLKKRKLGVYDKYRGHAFLEDFIAEDDRQQQAFDEQLEAVKVRYKRRWKRMLAELDDPLAKPLLVYVGVGKLLYELENVPEFTTVHPGAWFSLETAYDYYWKLRQTFKSDISLVYIDIPEDPDEREADIFYSENNFVAATYDITLKRGLNWVNDAVGVQFGDLLYPRLLNVQEQNTVTDGLSYEPVICREGENLDVYYINEELLRGYSIQDGELQQVNVESYMRGVELTIHTDDDKVVTFKKGAQSVEYICQ